MYEVRLVEWGTANRYGNVIEIHKDLIHDEELLGPILKHEFEHTDKAFSLFDFFHDLLPIPNMSRLRMLEFMLKRPKTWIQLSPIILRKGGLVFDINLLIIYSLIGMVYTKIFLTIF